MFIDRVPKVDVDLEPGVYVFRNHAGSGKTRLAALLNRYRGFGEKVTSFTYADVVEGRSLLDLIGKGYELILVDRYDLYQSDDFRTLAEACPEAIILVDCKHTLSVEGDVLFPRVFIELSREGVEVFR